MLAHLVFMDGRKEERQRRCKRFRLRSQHFNGRNMRIGKTEFILVLGCSPVSMEKEP